MVTFEHGVRACEQAKKLPACATGSTKNIKCYGRRLLVDLGACTSAGEQVKLYSIFYPLHTTVERDEDLALSDKGKGVTGHVQVLPAAYDRATPMDWHLTGPNSVYASDAWVEGVMGTPDKIVAVIDSGLDPLAHDGYFEHPIVPGRDFCSDPSACDDGNGRDMDYHEPASCGLSHGTAVALTMAGKKKEAGNGQYTQGVAPGIRIMPIRALGCEYGSQSDLADSIAWAAGAPFESIETNPHAVSVISISLSGVGPCNSYLQNAVDVAHSKGILVVVSSGNEATSQESMFPANCRNTVAVGASDIYGHLASYSNTKFDIAAPGGDGNGLVPINYPGQNVTYWAGTSFAAPIVSGMMILGRQMYGVDFADTPATEPWDYDQVLFGTSCISNGIISFRGKRMRMNPCPSLWEEAMPEAHLPWEHYRPWGYDHDRDMRDLGAGLIWVFVIFVCFACLWAVSFYDGCGYQSDLY